MFYVMPIHNHPEPMPLSPQDLARLLIEECPEVNTAAFVSSSLEKMIIFRGKNTPELPSDVICQKTEAWRRELIFSCYCVSLAVDPLKDGRQI